jgi:hypothetical protein
MEFLSMIVGTYHLCNDCIVTLRAEEIPDGEYEEVI